MTASSTNRDAGQVISAGVRNSSLLDRLAAALHIQKLFLKGDDPVCLSALDESTLRRYGYSESQIHLMKESALR
ncbi:MAG TPA: hypothetical protein VE986_10815 [Hyphomicrobiales bacterium]|nr:hypothetical protein [Hyphomicrobiales bacterium]